jgi:hypothetical protein
MNFWAWGGKYIGTKHGNYLYSASGKPLGTFYNEEIYDFRGHYIGEIKSENRLIYNKSKSNRIHSVSMKPCNSTGCSYCDYVGYIMYAGYEDFKVNN